MKAAVVSGPPWSARLALRDVARPHPSAGQLLVAVRAAGVDGLAAGVWPGKGWIPGLGISGEVVAVGPEIGDLEPGDAVYAMLDRGSGGGWAEYAVVRRSSAAPKPEALSHEEAAAMVVLGLTALQALRDRGGLAAGQRVAVHGAAAGAGPFAVQIAAAAGARVTAVAGPGQQDFLRRLGAARVVDDSREDFTALDRTPAASAAAARAEAAASAAATAAAGDEAGSAGVGAGAGTGTGRTTAADDDDLETYDVIFDALGVLSLGECEPALAPSGIFLTVRRGSATWIARLRAGLAGVIARGASPRIGLAAAHPSGGDLEALAQLAAAGRLHASVDRVYPLAEAAAAVADLSLAAIRGQLALRIGA